MNRLETFSKESAPASNLLEEKPIVTDSSNTSGAMVAAGVILLLASLAAAVWVVNDMNGGSYHTSNQFTDMLFGFLSSVALAAALVVFAHSEKK